MGAGAGGPHSSIVGWPGKARQTDFSSLHQAAPYDLDNLPVVWPLRANHPPAEGHPLALEDTLRFELYTREGCHLCEAAHKLLQSYGIQPELIDIDARSDLLADYNHCVPVVVVDGKVRFRGKIDRVLLERLLVGK